MAFGRTVEELHRSLSYREYVDWAALAGIHPFGEAANDLRAGMILSLLANINRNRKKRGQPYGWLDFITWRRPLDYAKQQIRKALK